MLLNPRKSFINQLIFNSNITMIIHIKIILYARIMLRKIYDYENYRFITDIDYEVLLSYLDYLKIYNI